MIVRGQRPQGNFYILNKAISEDRRLSWAARGLLVFLLGKPDHWQVSTTALINETAGSPKPLARDAVHSLLKELIQAGYCTRHRRRSADGTMSGTDYHISETPQPAQPYTVAPETAKPDTVNPRQASIDGGVSIEKKKESASASTKRTAKPSTPEPTFDSATGKFEGLEQKTIDQWAQAHPGVDVPMEITRASCWLIANPEKNKVRYLRFLSGWMNRAERRPARTGSDTAPRPMSSRESNRQQWANRIAAAERRTRPQAQRGTDDAVDV